MVFSVFVQNEPFSIVLALVIFGSYLVIDAGYSYYTLSILKRRPFAAAATGSMMYVLLAFGVLSYTQNWLYLIPMIIGSFCGTYFIVARDARSAVRE